MNNPKQKDGPRFLQAESKGPRDEQQDAAVWLTSEQLGTALLVVSDGVVTRVLRGLYASLPRAVALSLPVPQDRIFRLADGAIEEIVIPGPTASAAPS